MPQFGATLSAPQVQARHSVGILCHFSIFVINFSFLAFGIAGIANFKFGRISIPQTPSEPKQQLNLPWIPPVVTARAAASGIRSSVLCNATCRARFSCNEEQTKICFWDDTLHCACRDPVSFPTEWRKDYQVRTTGKSMRDTRNLFAVLMAGQPRSLMTRFMQKYWQLVLSRLQDHSEVVLFAVLSRQSTNKKLSRTVNHTYQTEELKRVLGRLAVTWRAEFPYDATWEESARLVTDAALRFLLSPPLHLLKGNNKDSGGFANQYRARAVAFDLMLRFETEYQTRFTHVMFVRPDRLYEFSPNMVQSIEDCQDAVFCINDGLAGMKRHLAPWYATHVASIRSFTGSAETRPKEETQKEIQRFLGWNFTGGGIYVPTMHLAIHGVPFAGRNLEVVAGDVPCGGSDLATWGWIIRDVQNNFSSQPSACLWRSNVSRLATIRNYLSRLGMTDDAAALVARDKS